MGYNRFFNEKMEEEEVSSLMILVMDVRMPSVKRLYCLEV